MAQAPVVSNVVAQQRSGTKLVDITYDVIAVTPTVTISLRISNDGGASYNVPATTLSGAVGSNVTTGTGKVITWNAGLDWKGNYNTGMRFEVTADDGVIPPTITSQPASQIIASGSTATLTVTASGSSPLTYQWYQGAVGTTTTPVGTNSASFTTPALSATTTYWVRVSNSLGSVNSTLATVTVGADLALIPAGAFQMGVTSGDTDSYAPSVSVTVSDFYMGKNEVTKALWDEVRTWATANGYTDLETGAGKATNHPVQNVSWFDVIKWCNARSQKEGLTPCYSVNGAVMKTGTTEPTVNWTANGYRIPTEAEWEKAARGGVSGKRFPWGTDTISHSEANFRNSGSESYKSGTTGYHPTYNVGVDPYTSPVGSFAANGFGLHDMAGNVMEWCWDRGNSTYVNEATDPRGAASGWGRVPRGGSYADDAFDCRAAGRSYIITPTVQSLTTGFRIARTSVP
jgi:formylglycine-generating enzyme required for sulfatase activity